MWAEHYKLSSQRRAAGWYRSIAETVTEVPYLCDPAIDWRHEVFKDRYDKPARQSYDHTTFQAMAVFLQCLVPTGNLELEKLQFDPRSIFLYLEEAGLRRKAWRCQ